MADELRIGLQELLRKAQVEGEADFLRGGCTRPLAGDHGDGQPDAP